MRKVLYLKSKKHTIDLEPYSGNWVAFVDNQPVAWAKDLNLLMQKVKKQCLLKQPSVMLVPRKNEGPYILIIL